MEHLKRGQTWQITESNREQSYRKREQNHKQNTNKTQTYSPTNPNYNEISKARTMPS